MTGLIHDLLPSEVPGFLTGVRSLLRPGGSLLLKEVSDPPHCERLFTLALDRLMIGLREPIRSWPPDELVEPLQSLGFDVKRHTMNDYLPYPHMFCICRRGDGDSVESRRNVQP